MATQQDKAVIDLVINGQQSETSLYKIKTAAVNAQKALSRMAETDPGYAKQKKELESLLVAQDQRTVRLKREKEAIDKYNISAGQLMTGIVGGNLVEAGLSKLLQLGPAVVDRSLKIKDSFADIAKAADMSNEEVEALNDNLKEINTRTSTQDLRGIAVVGGQFGIAKKDMEGFVESADKLNVALGDQFDSVEKVAEVNLTLRNTFQDIKSENIGEDMLHIGNAMNFLEAQGAATAPVMADFSSRIGGVAIPLGLTSGQVLGLSATLQELNVSSERGSTAVVDIVNGIAKAPEAFAKYARGVDGATLSNAQFKDLVNSDLNGALMAVIRGFKEGDTSATGMAAKLADMDLKGNGVMEVFMKLISNTDLLTQRQQEASEQLQTTASVTAEFNKKNHDLAINLKKLGEWFDSFLENGSLMRFADGIVSITVKLLGLNSASVNAAKNYTEQRTKVDELTTKMLPLIERHEQLAKKSKLSADEQQELKKLTAQLASNMPQAVTQFDQYGKAIGVSTTRMRELIQAQKDMQQQMKADAKSQLELDLRSQEWERKQIQQQLNKKKKVTVSASGNATALPLSPADVQQLQKELDASYQKTQQTLRAMKDLEGVTSTADRRKSRRGPEPTAPKTNPTDGTQETEAERKAREKKEKQQQRQNKKETATAQKHENELERLIVEARMRTADEAGHEFEKEQIKFGEKYARMFELAGTSKQKQTEISDLMYKELTALTDKYDKEDRKKAEDKLKKQLEIDTVELESKKLLAQYKIDLAVADGSKTQAQGEAEKLQIEQTFLLAKEGVSRAHYAKLTELHKNSAQDSKRIEGESQQELAKISQDRYQANQKEADAHIKQFKKDRDDDVRDRENQRKQDLLEVENKGKKGLITVAEQRNAEMEIERKFLLDKRKIYEDYYDLLSRLGMLSSEEQQDITRKKNEEFTQLDDALANTEQQQYEGRLGGYLKFLDEKKQYINDAATIANALFAVDQDKLSVGPLLSELDTLKQKTSLTANEQERMNSIVAQIGKVMPDAVTSTDAYGNAISVNTDKARKEVDAQKTRAGILQKVAMAERAWALASVGIAYGKALMQAVTASGDVPFPGNLLAIAGSIAKVTLSHGAALAQILSTNVSAPAFADGGFTNTDSMPSGYTTGPTYYNKKNFIAGEAGTEWIMSAPMLRNPVMANIAGALQALQVSGQYKSMGSVGASAGATGGSTAQAGGGMSDGYLLAIYQQLELNNQRMEEMAKRPINQNYFKVRETEDRVAQIDMETSL